MNEELVQRASRIPDHLEEVQAIFPTSLNLKAHRALIHYQARGSISISTYNRIR
jgi:hypothetical protein